MSVGGLIDTLDVLLAVLKVGGKLLFFFSKFTFL